MPASKAVQMITARRIFTCCRCSFGKLKHEIKQMAGIVPESYESFLSAVAAADMILLTDLLRNGRSFKKGRYRSPAAAQQPVGELF